MKDFDKKNSSQNCWFIKILHETNEVINEIRLFIVTRSDLTIKSANHFRFHLIVQSRMCNFNLTLVL